jgi:SAM-dependent methyltransferase
LLRCRHCGIGITQPPLADVAFLYEDRESQDYQPGTTGLAYRIKQLAFSRDARRLLGQLGAAPASVLDYGCGSGLFTRCLGNVIGADRVVGSDFHSSPPADLADRRYLPNNRLDSKDGEFDVALMMHVLEHDDDPVSLLARVAGYVRPGGRIVIEVPNIDCVWAGVFGEAWDAWYMPFHRIHFSRAGLRAVVERSGLTVEREIAVCLPSMGRTLANLFGMRNSLPLLLAGVILHPIQWLAERASNRPSALRFIVRKPER